MVKKELSSDMSMNVEINIITKISQYITMLIYTNVNWFALYLRAFVRTNFKRQL